MHSSLVWHNETIAKKTVEALKQNRFSAEYAPDKKTALEAALAAIPAGSSIGLGGSISKDEIGLPEALRTRGHEIFDHHRHELSPDERIAERRRGMLADVFIASSNAVTLDGQLLNIDGTGNRVAALTFGPGKVVLIVGVNKIVPDLDSGLKRLQMLASPANNQRLNLKNPCATTGLCENCNSPSRICNVTVITHKKPSVSNIHIILVGEALGF